MCRNVTSARTAGHTEIGYVGLEHTRIRRDVPPRVTGRAIADSPAMRTFLRYARRIPKGGLLLRCVMVVVHIELWPGGDKTRARPLGTVRITNDGTGTNEFGNCTVSASHAGMFYGKRPEPYKTGIVRRFARRLSPYRLVCRALRALGET